MNGIDSKASEERIFGTNGPLATFGGRITMAYHLGWLSKSRLRNINNFRKIRNTFAHRAFDISYNDKKIQSLFEPIVHDLEEFDKTAVIAVISAYPEHTIRRLYDLERYESYLSSLALLTGNIFLDLLVLPEARRNNVNPADLISNESSRPTVVEHLQHNMIRSILEIFNSDKDFT